MKFFLNIILILTVTGAYGQTFDYSQVPQLKFDDFKGNKAIRTIKNATAYTTWSVNYNIRRVRQIDYQRSEVTYNYVVVLRKEFSWIYKNLLRRNDELKKILNHERGHLFIAFLLANILAKKMNKIYYGNFNQQSRNIFNQIFLEFSSLEGTYDIETDHSKNKLKQHEWDLKLKKMFYH